MKTFITIILSMCSLISWAQSSQVYPDSIVTVKLKADSVESKLSKTDSLIADLVASKEFYIYPYNTPSNNSPVFIKQDSNIAKLTTQADSFALQVPAAAFRPEHFDANPSLINPSYYGNPQIFVGGLTWSVDAFVPLVAPVNWSLNHVGNNIRVKEIEVCALDQNSSMDLLAMLHETYFDAGVYKDSVIMYARSAGSSGTNLQCWQSPPIPGAIDNFNLKQATRTYWIEVVPFKKELAFDPQSIPNNGEFGIWPPLVTGSPGTATGRLRLLNVRFYYSHK